MNKPKITFGKIKLGAPKDSATTSTSSADAITGKLLKFNKNYKNITSKKHF